MQVVLITGGSMGIGRATGELLQSNGYTVIGTSRSPERYADHPFPLIQMDLHDALSIHRAVETVVSQYGAIDVLVNNAGKGIAGPIEETPLEEIRSIFETNLVGATSVLQSVLPVMRTQNKGKIINITSIAAYSGLPFRAAYSASKSALHMLTESLRLELNPTNIHCCTLAPGDVATNISKGRYHVPVKENSPYQAIYGAARKDMDAHVDDGVSAKTVAISIYRLVRKNKLKPHYTVGPFLQRFSLYLKSYLPAKIYEFILSKFYNL
jgi:NAD(P)-dependent dehydrogenase (short-subunit alcohol dehydrogenase family)